MNLQIAATDEPVDFLRHKSSVYKSRMQGFGVSDVLIVDDSATDARAMGALVRSAFGQETTVRHATSLLRGKNMLLERVPELIVLDDILPPKDRAETSIAQLREAQYTGAIVVVSGEMTRLRRLSLLQCGASAVVHKDDINAAALVQSIVPDKVGEEYIAVAKSADGPDDDLV